MADIEIAIKLQPATLERLDALVRECRRLRGGALAGLERNEILLLAIELGIRQIEGQFALPPAFTTAIESEDTPRSVPSLGPGLRPASSRPPGIGKGGPRAATPSPGRRTGGSQ